MASQSTASYQKNSVKRVESYLEKKDDDGDFAGLAAVLRLQMKMRLIFLNPGGGGGGSVASCCLC